MKNDGTLWATGFNAYGRLGVGDKVPSGSSLDSYTSTLVEVTSDVKEMRGGANHTLILKNDDTLWGVGANHYGQLGVGDTENRNTFVKIANNVKDISVGAHHSLFLENNGTLWATGSNGSGQLGNGQSGRNVHENTPIEVTSNVKEMRTGAHHTLILKNDDTVWTMGSNYFGALGLGDNTDRLYPVEVVEIASDIKDMAAGGGHTIILKNDDTIWTAGWNSGGQLGLGETDDRDTCTQIILYDEQNIILNPVYRSWHYGYNGYTSTIDVPLQKSGEVRSVQLQSGYGPYNYITGLSIRTVEYANKDVSGDLNADPGIVEIERYRGNPGYGPPRTIGFDDYYYADKIVVVLYNSYNRAAIVISEVTAKVRLY